MWTECGQFLHLLNWCDFGHYKNCSNVPSLDFLPPQFLLHVLDFLWAKKRSIRDNGKPGEDQFLLRYVFFFFFFWRNRWKLDGDAQWGDVNQTLTYSICEHLIQAPGICIMLALAPLLTLLSPLLRLHIFNTYLLSVLQKMSLSAVCCL